MHARLMPAGDSWVVVCDYTPVPIPWGWEQGHTQTALTPEESQYAAFLTAMGQTHHRQKINGIGSIDQISMRGKIGIRDCFEVRSSDEKENLYVIPTSEYEKVRETGVHLKTEKMEESLEGWWAEPGHLNSKDSKLQSMATHSLLGHQYDYLVPVISGLKPIALDFHDTQLTEAAVSSLKGVLFVLDKPEPALINKRAVTQIVNENQDVFNALGISSAVPPQIIVQKVLSMRHGPSASHITKKSPESIALGLLLGYDHHSCIEFHRFNPGWAQGKDHPFVGAIPHQINEFPFNIWGVDYGVVDPESNDDFATLRQKYDDLQQVVESLLESGESPLNVLSKIAVWQELEKSVPAIREGFGLKLRRVLKSAATQVKKLGGAGRRNHHNHH